MLDDLRDDVCSLHMELPRNNLVSWISGSISTRDPETGYFAIKPSGVYFYRNRYHNFAIIHTHSTFSTAFSAVGKPIPAILTVIFDELGGPIPIGGFAPIGNEEIGREVGGCCQDHFLSISDWSTRRN